ncbi:MAG: uroporphyrinogen-III synthase [Acidobacteriota bacterium]|nr:uroporphyrinogen-III synthase [Acidobacteriota bacterium]
MSTQPVPNRRILVTRSAGQASKLSEGLTALGFTPVEVPVLAIVPPHSYDHLDSTVRTLDRFDWLILTSTNAVDAFRERCLACDVDPRRTGRLKVAVIGRATADAASAIGLKVSVVPETQVAEGLIRELKDVVRGKHILLPRAELARDILPHALRAAGAHVDIVEAYRNALPEDAPAKLSEALEQKIAAATFTSSSSVSHLAEAAKIAWIKFPLDNVPAVSIGPITSHTLRGMDWPPAVEAAQHDIPGLLDAVRTLFEGKVITGVFG